MIVAPTLAGQAAEVRLQSAAGRPASLIELYTSEGCSSCPPAEEWFSGLLASPQLWKDFVPVAFHVDYWDNLGWKDRFASPAWTQRQHAYAARWGATTVYTPEFVLNGAEWERSGAAPPAGTGKSAGSLAATISDGKTVRVQYHSAPGSAGGRKIYAALLASDVRSSVKAGENRGRSLRHDFVALSCEGRPLAGETPAEFTLPAAPPDAKRLAVAVWVENARSEVEQATGGWIQ